MALAQVGFALVTVPLVTLMGLVTVSIARDPEAPWIVRLCVPCLSVGVIVMLAATAVVLGQV